MPAQRILTINTGSSSLKVALYAVAEKEARLLAAQASAIGLPNGRLRIVDGSGAALLDRTVGFLDHAASLTLIFDWLMERGFGSTVDAIGHRIVHGGDHYSQPRLVTPEVLATLDRLVPLAPDHLPEALAAVRAAEQRLPALPQVACFDTAFHRTLPAVAKRYPLPRALYEDGVVRYGFHGLSYEYVLQALQREAGTTDGRVIIAHLGSGASMAAVRDGVSVETTMGLTPTGGLMMATRSGDLDPGVLLYLLQEKGLSPATLSDLLNAQSGLRGVSAGSADMADLLAREATDVRAAEAVDLFCYTAKKTLGGLCTILGGVDSLVFTAGIGEHAPQVRDRICADLGFLGIALDPQRNAANAPVISRDAGRVVVRVIPTDEARMIARHTAHIIGRA